MTDKPLYQDTLTYTGHDMRYGNVLHIMGDGTALGVRSGVRPGDPGLTVSLAGSTISVSAGIAAVRAYVAVLTSAWSGTLTAADATYTRIDLVYLRVWDTDTDGSGLRQTDVVYQPGTASATPVAPAPSGSVIYMPLATITVPPSGGGSASVSSAVRPTSVAAGGILPSSTAPTSPYTGQYYDDGNYLHRYSGSAWRVATPILPTVSEQISTPGSFTAATFVDFTSGQWPPITVTVPQSGIVAISIGAAVRNTNTTTSTGWAAFRLSGATTEAATEKTGVSCAGGRTYATRRVFRSGLTPGASLTVTPQYQFSSVNASSAVTGVDNGQMSVEPVAG